MQHAHDRSTAAKCTPVSVGVSGILLVLASCTGVVPADGFDEYKGGGGGGGGEGGAGGGGTRVEDSCSTDRPSAGAANWRRLTSVQYKNTIKDLLGLDADVNLFLSDTTTGHFLTNVGTATPDPQILKYQDTAGKLAAEAVRDLEKLMGCKASTGEDACALRFFNDFGARALRRPLTDVDLKLFDSVYRIGKQEGFATGVRLTVEAILQSPSFLYLVETGGAASNGVAAFDAYEMASRLSYVLWNTMPDAELTKAARDGSLNNLDGLRKEAQRLMNSPRFLDTLFAFHEQLFGVDKLGKQGGVVRDLKRYPAWSAVLTTAMRDETRQFVASVFSKGDGTLKELLTAPYGFPTGPLVAFYGSGQSVGSDGKFMFPDGSRRGILTQAATLSSAVPFDSLYRAVLRGKLLREQIFC